jgi:hypothetical protein
MAIQLKANERQWVHVAYIAKLTISQSGKSGYEKSSNNQSQEILDDDLSCLSETVSTGGF